MINFLDVKEDFEIKKLSALAKEIWEEYWVNFLSRAQLDFMVEKFQSYEAMRAQIRDENYIYKIILKDGAPVGYFGAAPKDKRVWECEDENIGFRYLFLSKLYVKKDFRGKGIGRIAFEEVKRLAAQELGVKEPWEFGGAGNEKFIYLTVNKNNLNTIEAYKKWGFQTVEKAVTLIGNGFVMDDYIMRYPISEVHTVQP